MAFRLNRRTMLLGAGGVAIGLPLLESMLESGGERGRARAGTMPTRFAIVFAGMALGGDEWSNDRSMIAGVRTSGETGNFIADTALGSGFALTQPLMSLSGLRDRFSLVSNMRIPFSASSADPADVPPGGAFRDFHGGGASPLLSGVRSTEARFTANGITSDQVIAGLHPGMDPIVFRAQPSWYLSGSSYAGRQYISYRGAADPIEAQTSPQIGFSSLFGGFVPDDDGAAAQLDFERRARRSVLDVVLGKRDRLVSRLGRVDRVRIERHFDEIRQLELRIAALPPPAVGECMSPADPGTDPAIGGDNTGSGSDDIRPGSGYSMEHERSRLMADLIHMAFTCDISRVATLQVTTFQSHMSVLPVSEMLGTPFYADLHELGHNGDANNRGQRAVSAMVGWHVSHYAYLMQKMQDTVEGDGTLLDHSVVLFVSEAGHGTQLNDGVSNFATHSVERMCMLVGGGGGGLLRPGQHIDAGGAHPAQCLITGMQAAGYDGDTLGEVSGTIPALYGA